jgi:hypothetical protein
MSKPLSGPCTLFWTDYSVVFASWLDLVAVASAAQTKGRWLFVDGGSGVEIATCSIAADGLMRPVVLATACE